jgi:hypothetical protein
MNPAAFSGHAGTMVPAQGAQMTNLPQLDTTQISKHVMSVLHAQGPFSGWRQQVHPQDRVKNVMMLYALDSTREQVSWIA